MKKLFYIMALTVIATASLASCTEEVVQPKNTGGATGAGIKE